MALRVSLGGGGGVARLLGVSPLVDETLAITRCTL